MFIIDKCLEKNLQILDLLLAPMGLSPNLLELKTFVSQVKAGASWNPLTCRLEQS